MRRSANNNPYLDEAFSPSAFRPLSTLPELPGLDAADRALATDVLTVSHTVEPAAKPSPFRGRIWVLVDESVYSASESFVLFCQQTGFATLVGRTTGGDGIGAMDPVYLQLPNSGILIQYTVPFGLNPDGSSNEEMGTTPRSGLPGGGTAAHYRLPGHWGGIITKERAAQFRAARAASRKVFSTGCRNF